MKPLTWWQRNGVQGRAEVLLFYVLALLLVVLFVLLATRGWANHLSAVIETLECSERNHYCGQTLGHDAPSMPQVGTGVIICGDPAKFSCEQITTPTPCEQKMEAAMRAMDAYLTESAQARLMDRIVLPKESVLHQWEAVKRECWRDK